MSGKYASKTDVPVSKSRDEVERTLAQNLAQLLQPGAMVEIDAFDGAINNFSVQVRDSRRIHSRVFALGLTLEDAVREALRLCEDAERGR